MNSYIWTALTKDHKNDIEAPLKILSKVATATTVAVVAVVLVPAA